MIRTTLLRTALRSGRMAALGGFACLAVAASGQDGDPARVDHLEALKACQQIADPTGRLDCFDRAVSTMVSATEEGELQLVDKDEVTKTRRRLFGFALPDLGIFKGPGDGEDDELDRLQSTITRVVSVRRDTITFEIEEGGVWEITNAKGRTLRAIKPGAPVEFKKAALGSYFIRVSGQIGVKGRRIR